MANPKFQLHEVLGPNNLHALEDQFTSTQSEKGIFGEFNLDEFKEIMNLNLTPAIKPDDLENIFTRLDYANVGVTSWKSFLLYLESEREMKTRPMLVGSSIEAAVSGNIQVIHTHIHEDAISKIDIMPLNVVNEIDFTNARYVTISKEGTLALWTPSWKLKKYRNINDPLPLYRKVKTFLLDMACMSNVDLIGISCSDDRLRFFDSQSLELLFILEGFSSAVVTISYWFNPKDPNFGILLLGDTSGSVTTIHFTDCLNSKAFGPKPNKNTIQTILITDIMAETKSRIYSLKYKQLHQDWVKQLRYEPFLKCVMSCSSTSQRSLVLIRQGLVAKADWIFNVDRGVNCFDFNPRSNLLATGGIDRLIRIWNPHITTKPIMSFVGHGSPVINLFLTENLVFSLSSDKILKVWDTVEDKCIQNLPLLNLPLGNVPISSAYFNPHKRALFIAANNICTIQQLPRECDTNIDSYISHPTPITGIVYSELYNKVVSVCQYGLITAWDIHTGMRKFQIQKAHFIKQDGEEIPTAISAICLDGAGKRLYTCGLDGYLKSWNLGSGCMLINSIKIPEQNIITAMALNNNVYLAGWSHRIYCCNLTSDSPKINAWRVYHTDDITSLSHVSPDVIISSSWDGQICLWQDENALLQAFSLDAILAEEQLTIPEAESRSISRSSVKSKQSISSVKSVKSLSGRIAVPETKNRPPVIKSAAPVKTKIKTTSKRSTENPLCPIVQILCLKTRPAKPKIGNLLAADVMGRIQVWSTTSPANVLAAFASVSSQHHYTTCMTTDSQNKFLITGDSSGYVRIWYIRYYCIDVFKLKGQQISQLTNSEINKFPFCRKKLRLVAERALQKLEPLTPYNLGGMLDIEHPKLLSSYQAHVRAIGEIIFIESRDLIITSSSDQSIRMWTLHGRFIGIFGDPRGWNLSKLTTPPLKSKDRKIPADVRRVSSATTFQVLFSGLSVRWWKIRELFLNSYLRAILMRKKSVGGMDIRKITAPMLAARKMSRKIVSSINYGPPLGNYFTTGRPPIPKPVITSKEMRKTLCTVYKYIPCHRLENISLANAQRNINEAKLRKSRTQFSSASDQSSFSDKKYSVGLL